MLSAQEPFKRDVGLGIRIHRARQALLDLFGVKLRVLAEGLLGFILTFGRRFDLGGKLVQPEQQEDAADRQG